MNSEILKIAAAIAVPQIGGLVGAFLILPELMGWYQRLNFPPIVPPNWVFPPVWTILNAGMGYASYLVWKDGGGFDGTARLPLIMYGTQLVLNWAWTPLFFKLHKLKWVEGFRVKFQVFVSYPNRSRFRASWNLLSMPERSPPPDMRFST